MKINKDWITKLVDASFVLLDIFIILILLTINYKPVSYFFFIAYLTTLIFLVIMVWIEEKTNEDVEENGDKDGSNKQFKRKD
jgi:ABC-type bacteriocin/lantibiotic exporter with double-glycine peptidase domain